MIENFLHIRYGCFSTISILKRSNNDELYSPVMVLPFSKQSVAITFLNSVLRCVLFIQYTVSKESSKTVSESSKITSENMVLKWEREGRKEIKNKIMVLESTYGGDLPKVQNRYL